MKFNPRDAQVPRWINGHGCLLFGLTPAGVRASGDDLSPRKMIRMGSYHHDLQLVDLATALVRQTGGHFVTERRLRQERELNDVGITGHVHDGLLERPGQKPIAIELELSTKGWRRLQGIMADYVANLDIGEV